MSSNNVVEFSQHPKYLERKKETFKAMQLPVTLNERYNFYLAQMALNGSPVKSYEEWSAG